MGDWASEVAREQLVEPTAAVGAEPVPESLREQGDVAGAGSATGGVEGEEALETEAVDGLIGEVPQYGPSILAAALLTIWSQGAGGSDDGAGGNIGAGAGGDAGAGAGGNDAGAGAGDNIGAGAGDIIIDVEEEMDDSDTEEE